MSHFVRLAALCLGAALVSSPGRAAEPLKAEVLHWWTSGGEAASVKVLSDAFAKSGGQWIDSAIAGGEAARTAGINRIVGGNPPAMMQFNTGKQLDELVANGYLATLDAAAEAGHWASILPKPVVTASMRDGHWYALPLNIHGSNWLFSNSKVLADAGLTAPKTWDEVVALGPKLKARGVIPLAHGGQSWQDHILFNAVLLSEGGSDLYFKVYGKDAQAAIASPAFKRVAETFKQLRGLMDPGMPGRNWNDATSLVITGKAAFQVMGDWAKGEFVAAGQVAGRDYGCSIVGPDDGYIMGGDVFVFPKLAGAEAAQAKLESLMLSPDVQIAFNMKKGSIPARMDLDVSKMDACAQRGAAAVKDPKNQIPSSDYLISPDENGAMNDVITQYLNSEGESADEFVSKFAAAVKAAG